VSEGTYCEILHECKAVNMSFINVGFEPAARGYIFARSIWSLNKSSECFRFAISLIR